MTKSEIAKRKQYLPKGGCRLLEDLLTNRNGGKTVIKQRTIAAILRKERKDKHGVLELFKEVTDLEKKKREKAAKEIAKQLAA
jgi:hypothetical protein